MSTAAGTAAGGLPGPATAGTRAVTAASGETQQALVPVCEMRADDKETFTGPVKRLPVELDVVVPVEEFRVRHLLALEPGKVISSQWSYGDDVPLAAGAVQLAWSEFEVIDNQLAVRITRLP